MSQAYSHLTQQMLLDFQQQRLDSAERVANAVLRLNSKDLVALQILGLCMAIQGRLLEAVTPLSKAAQLDPKNAELLSNLVRSQHGAELYREALETYAKLLRLVSDSAQIQTDRGTALAKLKRFDEAEKAYEKAISLQPDYFLAWSNRGNLFNELHLTEQAIQSYEKALQINPNYAETWTNLGNAFFDLNRFSDAVIAHEKALSLNPEYGEAWSNYGNTLLEMKEDGRAYESYAKAFQIKPDVPFLYGQLLSAKLGACQWDQTEPNANSILARVDAAEKACLPFVLLSTPASLAQQLSCAKVFIADRCPPVSNKLVEHQRPMDSNQKIRIGYFSSDFKQHPVGILMENILHLHDRRAFEFYGFFLNKKTLDPVEIAINRLFDSAHDLFGMTDKDAYTLISQHQLDIAIDLNGHTSGARTALFSHRLAPIQVNYLGYAGTSGATFFDYLIADPVVIPRSDQPFFTEKIAYLPDSFFPVDTSITDFGDLPSRDSQGLPADGFIFACFNNAYKIQPEIFRCWMHLLKSVEGSVLWLTTPSNKAIKNLQAACEDHGVDTSRLIFAKREAERKDHLSRLRLADLFLDTPYYNAHATCADALWAGIPVLTQVGSTFAGRVAASQLHALSLEDCITESSEAYTEKAIDLALNPALLKSIRMRLAQNSKTMPLFDSRLYVRNLENLYREFVAHKTN
jgi:predicted O-linked N-acetylglucosamine transferase (SPINDLY family)